MKISFLKKSNIFWKIWKFWKFSTLHIYKLYYFQFCRSHWISWTKKNTLIFTFFIFSISKHHTTHLFQIRKECKSKNFLRVVYNWLLNIKNLRILIIFWTRTLEYSDLLGAHAKIISTIVYSRECRWLCTKIGNSISIIDF